MVKWHCFIYLKISDLIEDRCILTSAPAFKLLWNDVSVEAYEENMAC